MMHILKIAAVVIVISYALRLVNAHSDVLVFGGLAVVGLSLYFLFSVFGQVINQLKSKL